MTLLTNPKESASPGVHALVIGVGKYPFLTSSADTAPAWQQGLGDLESPPLSALAMADWLQTQMHLNSAPLRSLDVLASAQTWCKDFNGASTLVEVPTMDNIQAAATRWFKAADSSPDNLALFYFSGHGFAVGDVKTLLAEDFGGNELDAFSHAIDQDKFVAGMLRCAANQQFFIFDSCSSQNHEASYDLESLDARPLISGTKHGRLKIVKRSVIRTSQLGSEAFGLTNPPRPSVFMTAFLQAVKGAAAKQDEMDADRWVVEPTPLKLGVDHLMKRFLKRREQCVSFDGGIAADFPLHVLTGPPVVPVVVACKPQYRTATSTLRCLQTGASRAPHHEPWHLDLPLSSYAFEAQQMGTGKTYATSPRENRPPHLIVSIPCES